MIYLLHIEPPFKHARHYLGFSEGPSLASIQTRISRHISGQGATLTRHAVKSGCELIHVLTMPGDRSAERALKKSHNIPRLCPLCRSERLCSLEGQP